MSIAEVVITKSIEQSFVPLSEKYSARVFRFGVEPEAEWAEKWLSVEAAVRSRPERGLPIMAQKTANNTLYFPAFGGKRMAKLTDQMMLEVTDQSSGGILPEYWKRSDDDEQEYQAYVQYKSGGDVFLLERVNYDQAEGFINQGRLIVRLTDLEKAGLVVDKV